MLHRLALRVLPSLTLAVTEDSVRKRKRLVMFVPGLVAFAVYRAAKQGFSLADPLTLLLLCGLVSMAMSVVTPIRRSSTSAWLVISKKMAPVAPMPPLLRA